MKPFIRIWSGKGISMLDPFDRRAWPWACAYALLRAKESCDDYWRQRFLSRAEQMADKRDVIRRSSPGAQATSMLQYLLTVCNICGEPAQFLVGIEGRCRQHQHVVTKVYAEVKKQVEEAASEYEFITREENAVRRKKESLSRLHRLAHHRK